MKKKEWNEGMNYLDLELIERHVKQKEKLQQKKQKTKNSRILLTTILLSGISFSSM